MNRYCENCEFLTGDGYEEGVCRTECAIFPSVLTVKDAEARLQFQNYLVGLNMPYRKLIDWIIHTLRDFPGHYRDEAGSVIATPGIASLLTPGAEFWFFDQIEGGKWQTIAEVPLWRREAAQRWRLIATAIMISEAVIPICRR